MYLGLYTLGNTIEVALPITVGDVPLDPDGGNPTYRIYEGNTLISGGVGALTKLDEGTITDATNATPIVITSENHGLETGNTVTITGVLTNTAANGTWTVTRIDSDTFSLDGSVGNGVYGGGGAWHITGLYLLTLAVTQGAGFDVGMTYQVRIDFTDGGQQYVKQHYFAVT